ncbi:MAG TPA: GNAT family N-acetyltransferase [Candidatus Limnocylindrales bacterium]|nr:GNAT family N-acetyltransferase [Candidatus Limnocylindrales bacterium]
MLIQTVTLPANQLRASQLLAQVAAVTRAAFLGAEPVPGLPTADGAFETPESVEADLGAGAWLAVARDRYGAVSGSVRAFIAESGAWVVRRLAVLPSTRGTGLSRALMYHLEESAVTAGATVVRLDAVVERGNPPFYASLGYTTVGHMPNPDKPLSEVAMLRDLTAPRRRLRYPWQGEAALGRYARLVTWHTDGENTLARVHCDVDDALKVAAEPVAGYTFAGADGCPVGIALREGSFATPPKDVPEFRMPRTVHPDLLALWRLRTK